jgi:hypothetical protein
VVTGPTGQLVNRWKELASGPPACRPPGRRRQANSAADSVLVAFADVAGAASVSHACLDWGWNDTHAHPTGNQLPTRNLERRNTRRTSR